MTDYIVVGTRMSYPIRAVVLIIDKNTSTDCTAVLIFSDEFVLER